MNIISPKRKDVSFFTHWGAIIFMAYLEAYENVEPVIYRNDTYSD